MCGGVSASDLRTPISRSEPGCGITSNHMDIHTENMFAPKKIIRYILIESHADILATQTWFPEKNQIRQIGPHLDNLFAPIGTPKTIHFNSNPEPKNFMELVCPEIERNQRVNICSTVCFGRPETHFDMT